jgi:hypothetical protein
MRHLFLLLTLTIISFSFICKKKESKDFKFISAQKQVLFGGVAGSPVVSLYRIKLKAIRNFEMICDSSYAEGKIDELFIQKDSFNTVQKLNIKKGQTFEFVFSVKTAAEMGGGDFQMEIPGSIEKNHPLAQENSVLLIYSGGKTNYFLVKKFDVLNPIFAP